jgi:hypothetical protein
MWAKLRKIRLELQRRRHRPVREQGAWVASMVRGYLAYHAVPTNAARLSAFRTQVIRAWHRSLRRRSRRTRLNWGRMAALESRWVLQVSVMHPWPEERFDVRTQGTSRVR